MAVLEPAPGFGLWPRVKDVTGWPEPDEGRLSVLAQDWRQGGTAFGQAGAHNLSPVRQVWGDDGGGAFTARAGQTFTNAADQGARMTALADRVDAFATEVTGVKNSIRATIAANDPLYGMIGLLMPAGVAGAAQTAFAGQVATVVGNTITEAAARVAGQGSLNAAAPAGARQGGEIDARVAAMEQALRDAGLLTGPPASGHYRQWLENAVRRGVPIETIKEIAAEHRITPEDFAVLDRMEEIREDEDGDGIFKSYFLMPTDISADDAANAVRMTYVLNAGTDYGTEGERTDFAPTPYGSDELQRITDRQGANSWSYTDDVGFVHGNGGRLMTTPNGMMVGLGGNVLQDQFSQLGGTAWGDTFMLNIDNPPDPAQQLREVATSGHAWYADDQGPYRGTLDLDRLLHHEERHSQQWAREGYGGFLTSYAGELITGGTESEEDAGLSDGGYR
jgi:hypothetical protein